MILRLSARVCIYVLALLCYTVGDARAQSTSPVIERAAVPVRVQLDAVPTGALVTMLLRDVLRRPYVIAPSVLADSQPMSVDLRMPRKNVEPIVIGFLRASGFSVQIRDGMLYVSKDRIADMSGVSMFPDLDVPSGSPLSPPREVVVPSSSVLPAQYPSGDLVQDETGHSSDASPFPLSSGEYSLIKPAHRSVRELADVVEAMFPMITIAERGGSAPNGSSIVDQLLPDQLVMFGEPDALTRAEQLVAQLDRPRPVVDIRAVILEVRSSRVRTSALSVLASILGDRLQVGLDPGASGQNTARIAIGGVEAVLSATRGDGRFKVVAEPSLSARSGARATINSGSQVPTLGSVSFTDEGESIRSVVYRDSGVTLSVLPVVRGGEIELTVEQERSTFVATTTGVNDSPTLNRSSASTLLAMQSGQTVIMAGLEEKSDQARKDGFLGGLLGGRSSSSDDNQLLVMIQADLASNVDQGQTSVIRLPAVGHQDADDTAPPPPPLPPRIPQAI